MQLKWPSKCRLCMKWYYWLSEIIKATIELYFWNTIYAIIFLTCSTKPSFSQTIKMSLRWTAKTFITDISCSVPSSKAVVGGYYHLMAFRTSWSIWIFNKIKRTNGILFESCKIRKYDIKWLMKSLRFIEDLPERFELKYEWILPKIYFNHFVSRMCANCWIPSHFWKIALYYTKKFSIIGEKDRHIT